MAATLTAANWRGRLALINGSPAADPDENRGDGNYLGWRHYAQ